MQAAKSVSSAASAVSSTLGRAVQGSGIKGIEAPLPKSVQRANAVKVRRHVSHSAAGASSASNAAIAALWLGTQRQASRSGSRQQAAGASFPATPSLQRVAVGPPVET
jgi:hypothetical protein